MDRSNSVNIMDISINIFIYGINLHKHWTGNFAPFLIAILPFPVINRSKNHFRPF